MGLPVFLNGSIFAMSLQDSLQASRDIDVEAGGSLSTMHRRVWAFFSRIFFQALTLTFVAEWGDRSQIATITLGAREVRLSRFTLVN